MVRSRVPDRLLTYFGNNFISQMVEEAIRGTSTLDLILTKKKKIVGEMKTDRNIQRELLCHSRVQGNQRGGGRLGKLIGKRQDSMARDVVWKMTQEDRTASKYSIVIIMTKKKNFQEEQRAALKQTEWLHRDRAQVSS